MHPGHTTRRRTAPVVVALSILAGLLLVARPLSGVDVLLLVTIAGLALVGTHEAITAERLRDRGLGALLLLGAALMAWQPPWGVHVLVLGLATVLIAEGTVRLRRGSRSRVALGAGLLLLGVLALAWPDVTVFVLGALLGVRLTALALPRLTWSMPSHLTATAVATVAVVLAGYTVAVTWAAPHPDRFYAAPQDTPRSPGLLLRAEPFTTDVPAGSQAWRILYSTTRANDEPVVASALVAVPDELLNDRPPVVVWAHGTTGFDRRCAPSLRTHHTIGAGGTAAVRKALDSGWAIVAPDYPGLGTRGVQPYLVGTGEARSVLDAVRAARSIPPLSLSRRTVVWGHSQGGHAALWTAMTQPEYAPDVRLAGAAAMAPVSNPATFLRDLQRRPVGTIFVAYALAAYEGTYDDVTAETHIRASARIPVQRIADRCLRSPTSKISLAQARIMAGRFVSSSLYEGGLGRRLSENNATGTMEAPLLIAQGESDRVVTLGLQDAYVRERCDAGQSLDYRTYAGRGHGGLLRQGSPFIDELVAWTKDRFASRPTTTTC